MLGGASIGMQAPVICAAIGLHFMHYNFARTHLTLRVTHAMAAGVNDHVWEVGEIVDLLK